MATIEISRAHHLQVDEAKRKLDGLLGRAKAQGIDAHWDGATCRLKGKGVDGKIQVGAARVDVSVDLSLFLRPMKGAIQGMIEKGLDRALA